MTTLRLAARFALAALCGTVLAQDGAAVPAGEEATALRPLHRGYAFDAPAILLRQHLFGRAHGLSLLAAACLDVPEQAAAAQEAYASWHVRQGPAIREMAHALATHYFGARAGEAGWSDLVRALKLKQDLRDTLGETRLEDACRTLPTVLIGPRYAFDRLLAEGDAGTGGTPPAVGPR